VSPDSTARQDLMAAEVLTVRPVETVLTVCQEPEVLMVSQE